ncbi:MAG: hypothetical protein LQ346_001925 [Caloplaca aetnensis]|nr:MAG: hypothetical protein LQ346_001925 [Caloplaca aetnensis]
MPRAQVAPAIAHILLISTDFNLARESQIYCTHHTRASSSPNRKMILQLLTQPNDLAAAASTTSSSSPPKPSVSLPHQHATEQPHDAQLHHALQTGRSHPSPVHPRSPAARHADRRGGAHESGSSSAEGGVLCAPAGQRDLGGKGGKLWVVREAWISVVRELYEAKFGEKREEKREEK